jgi:hypothetical protein
MPIRAQSTMILVRVSGAGVFPYQAVRTPAWGIYRAWSRHAAGMELRSRMRLDTRY